MASANHGVSKTQCRNILGIEFVNNNRDGDESRVNLGDQVAGGVRFELFCSQFCLGTWKNRSK